MQMHLEPQVCSFFLIYIYMLLIAIYRSTSMNVPILPPNKCDEGKGGW